MKRFAYILSFTICLTAQAQKLWTVYECMQYAVMHNHEVRLFMHYFVLNTIDRIFDHMNRMKINDTGRLRSSIHGIVYTNAGGNEALVRIFFLNYGRFIEYGLGRNYIYDQDLDEGGVKRGVGIADMDRPAINSFDRNQQPLDITFKGSRKKKLDTPQRHEHHKARPFLMNSIQAKVYKMSLRICENFAYVSAIHMSRSFIRAMYNEQLKMFINDDAHDAEWLRQMRLTIDQNNKSAEQLRKELHAMAVSEFDIDA